MADRSRLVANVAAVGLLVAIAGGVALVKHPWSRPTVVQAAPIPAEARSELTRQFQELTQAGTQTEFSQAAGTSDAARTFATEVWGARRLLGVQDARFSYVRGGDVVDRADGSTSCRVDVTWPDAQGKQQSTQVAVRLQPRTDGFDLIDVSRSGRHRLPLWLAGRISEVRVHGATVVLIDGGPANPKVTRELGRMAGRAHGAVGSVAGFSGHLTVIAPRKAETTAALLGRGGSSVKQIAAISTRLGGVETPTSVVLNPVLFTGLDRRARQVVLTHEATHVMSGVVGKDRELWVAEGFADFVALHDDRAPLRVSAGQILRQVRLAGAPKHLPTAKDFDESAAQLGASYEAAWMAFRMLGREFGDRAVETFYGQVVSGVAPDAAAQSAFGISEADLTNQWRRYLTKSASTAL